MKYDKYWLEVWIQYIFFSYLLMSVLLGKRGIIFAHLHMWSKFIVPCQLNLNQKLKLVFGLHWDYGYNGTNFLHFKLLVTINVMCTKKYSQVMFGVRSLLGAGISWGFLDYVHSLYSLLEGNRYSLSAYFRKKPLFNSKPCLIRNIGNVLYLYL